MIRDGPPYRAVSYTHLDVYKRQTVCGAGGDLERTPEGKWKFVIAPNGLERDRTTEEGRGVHCDEIAETQGGFFMDPKKREEVASKLPKYKEIQFPELD